MMKVGDRVVVAPVSPSSYAVGAYAALNEQHGVIEELGFDPFEPTVPRHLVRFDKPVRKWAFILEDEARNYITHFWLVESDLKLENG
jgi:hypothetical protein